MIETNAPVTAALPMPVHQPSEQRDERDETDRSQYRGIPANEINLLQSPSCLLRGINPNTLPSLRIIVYP